jgi:M6 family metalloprotease-like protein
LSWGTTEVALADPAVHILDLPVVIDARAQAPAPAPVPAAPAGLRPGAADDNLRLWLYDPRSAESKGLPTSIFIHNAKPGATWQPWPTGPDGSLTLRLAPGDYDFDTAEPSGMADQFRRHRYRVSVSAQGVASIAGLAPDARGWHAVTLDLARPVAVPDAPAQARRDQLTALANEPASTFRPQSACQLPDAVNRARSFASDTSTGFPKVRVRLASSGRIRALIVPVDFSDLAGRDAPGAFFTPLAQSMHDFYLDQSYGRVSFDFDILAHWVRLPFGPERFGIDAINGAGDFQAYREAIIALTDGQIDYGSYDAVYFLVPKEMPMARMGSGPAITAPTWTRTGYVINGATGGADMYFNEANGIRGAQWKWMAHETGHAFGLVDEDWNHEAQTLGAWSIMAWSWTNGAIEHNAWDRYLQGWLTESQVACLAKPGLAGAGARVKLSPIERRDGAVKAAMVPLGGSKILVLESRRSEGYDHIAAGHEGVLAYTVDTSLGALGGGYRTQRRPGSTDPLFEDAALRPGDTIAVEGVRVTVGAFDTDGDTVTLQTTSR